MTFGIGQLIVYTLAVFIYGFNWAFLIFTANNKANDFEGLAMVYNFVITVLLVILAFVSILKFWSVPIPA